MWSRQVFIGGDDAKGMGYCKAWKSLPIASWSGGWKLADAPGARPNFPVQGSLSALLHAQVLPLPVHCNDNMAVLPGSLLLC